MGGGNKEDGGANRESRRSIGTSSGVSFGLPACVRTEEPVSGIPIPASLHPPEVTSTTTAASVRRVSSVPPSRAVAVASTLSVAIGSSTGAVVVVPVASPTRPAGVPSAMRVVPAAVSEVAIVCVSGAKVLLTRAGRPAGESATLVVRSGGMQSSMSPPAMVAAASTGVVSLLP